MEQRKEVKNVNELVQEVKEILTSKMNRPTNNIKNDFASAVINTILRLGIKKPTAIIEYLNGIMGAKDRSQMLMNIRLGKPAGVRGDATQIEIDLPIDFE